MSRTPGPDPDMNDTLHASVNNLRYLKPSEFGTSRAFIPVGGTPDETLN